jgi:hypothetical protein
VPSVSAAEVSNRYTAQRRIAVRIRHELRRMPASARDRHGCAAATARDGDRLHGHVRGRDPRRLHERSHVRADRPALTPRTPTGVAARARRLGLATCARRWTADDDGRLRRVLPVGSFRPSRPSARADTGSDPPPCADSRAGSAAPAGIQGLQGALDHRRRRPPTPSRRPHSRGPRCTLRTRSRPACAVSDYELAADAHRITQARRTSG